MYYFDSYKYCPKCGFSLKADDKTLLCQKCGLRLFDNPKTGVCILIENSNHEVLVVRRAYDPYKGKWDIMGGFVDHKEDIKDTIVRECLEELGIRVVFKKVLSIVAQDYKYNGLEYNVIVVNVLVKYKSGTFTLQKNEVTDYKFINSDEAKKIDIAWPEFKKKLLRDYFKKLK